MDQQQVLAALALPPASRITLTGMTWILWGRDIQFAAQATPPDIGSMDFALHFEDCRELRWQLYTHQPHDTTIPFPPTELVNFKLGRDQHRSPAHLLTEHFGLSLMYGACVVVRGEQRVLLSAAT